jgi:hypothetical protein
LARLTRRLVRAVGSVGKKLPPVQSSGCTHLAPLMNGRRDLFCPQHAGGAASYLDLIAPEIAQSTRLPA